MVRLENFLDTVLRKDLDKVLRERDALFDMASSCVQLRELLVSMTRLSPSQDDGNRILVDLGHHFYMQAQVSDPSIVHINIGCGVVVPMNHDEAGKFLVKKERHLTEMAQLKTKETLRVKFRMRLVMEAISRIQDSTVLKKSKSV